MINEQEGNGTATSARIARFTAEKKEKETLIAKMQSLRRSMIIVVSLLSVPLLLMAGVVISLLRKLKPRMVPVFGNEAMPGAVGSDEKGSISKPRGSDFDDVSVTVKQAEVNERD